MKRVQKSNEPTIRQLLNMAANLREKTQSSTLIEIETWDFQTENKEQTFRIYSDSGTNEKFKSWRECQDYYFSIMRKSNAK